LSKPPRPGTRDGRIDCNSTVSELFDLLLDLDLDEDDPLPLPLRMEDEGVRVSAAVQCSPTFSVPVMTHLRRVRAAAKRTAGALCNPNG